MVLLEMGDRDELLGYSESEWECLYIYIAWDGVHSTRYSHPSSDRTQVRDLDCELGARITVHCTQYQRRTATVSTSEREVDWWFSHTHKHIHAHLIRFNSHGSEHNSKVHRLLKNAVREQENAFLVLQFRHSFPFSIRRCHKHRHIPIRISFHQHTILRELLLYEDHFFGAPNHEVAPRVKGAFMAGHQFRVRGVVQDTAVGTQHDGHAADDDIAAAPHLPAYCVLHVHLHACAEHGWGGRGGGGARAQTGGGVGRDEGVVGNCVKQGKGSYQGFGARGGGGGEPSSPQPPQAWRVKPASE